MRRSYAGDSKLIDAVFDLLEMVFPGLRAAAARARMLGALWEAVSTPFLHFEGNSLVSHIGVIELPLILLGRPVTAGSIHAVATHPDFRRRGHYRKLMEEVLEYCSGRYETLILSTENPEYYEPFGFRVLREHAMTKGISTAGDGNGLRKLDLEDSRDVEILNRLLETRAPLSHTLGVGPERTVFCFNEGKGPLYYCRDLDAMVCLELDGTALKLFDVVAPELPPSGELLGRMPWRVETVEANFATDEFLRGASPVERVFEHDGPSYLMARGPFGPEGLPFALPRPART
jgi:GNAT superfamily N-acetyltransferase